MLHAEAVLVANWQLVLHLVEAGDTGDRDGCYKGIATAEVSRRIHKRNVVERYVRTERYVGAGIVHVVALDALVHCAKAAAENRLAGPGEIIGEADARTERCPVVVH